MLGSPDQPQPFGRFLLTERIAVGGMAEIFLAKLVGAMGFEKRLVVKRILPHFAADRELVRMLAKEAKLVCNLEHPNIVQVYELGEVDGRYYIAMEYVNGMDLSTLWRALARRQLRMPVPLCLFVVSEMLKGLAFAHDAVGPDGRPLGVVHRDVSPSNVMVSFAGDVKLGDFGIAVVQQRSRRRASAIRGKYGYMTPEQLRGEQVDHRSDIFSSAVVLCELLTGQRLFRGESEFETMRRVRVMDTAVFDQQASIFPPQVVSLVRRALQAEPDRRYPTAVAFQDATDAHLRHIGLVVTSRTLATFIARHVSPGPAAVKQGLDDPHLEPQTISRSRELTPSGDLPPLPPPDVDDDTITQSGPGNQVVDWSVLDLELVHLDGSSVDDGVVDHGVTGVESVADEPEIGALLSSLAEPTDAPAQHFGEMKFDFDDGDLLKTEDEIRREEVARLEAELNRPVQRQAEANPLEGMQLELRLSPASSGPPTPEFHGSLATHSVTRVLFRLCLARESGLAVFTSSRSQTCQIGLEQGLVRRICADRTEQGLADHLLRTGLLQPQVLAEAVQARPGSGPITALVQCEKMLPLQISRQLSPFAQWSVLEAFGWGDGAYAFHRHQPCAEEHTTAYQGLELLARGVSHLDDKHLDVRLGWLTGRSLQLGSQTPLTAEQLMPGPPMPQIASALERPCTMDQVLSSCSRFGARRVKQALYLLMECELARVVRGQ